MAGRRLRVAVLDALIETEAKHLTMATYANDYSQYVTTKEEYDMQHYEGTPGKWICADPIGSAFRSGGHLHRLDLANMNPIGLLEQQEELRRLSQQIHFLSGKPRGEAERKKWYFQLIRRVRGPRKRLLHDLETVRRNRGSPGNRQPSNPEPEAHRTNCVGS